jgi:hypothetical protein
MCPREWVHSTDEFKKNKKENLLISFKLWEKDGNLIIRVVKT